MKRALTVIFLLCFCVISFGESSFQRSQSIDAEISALKARIESLEKVKRSIDSVIAEGGERPKIGLALGGGGAKGAALIGVLRVLEEYDIPVDYIAGTSIGSIVGSMYSIGYTPDEIEQYFNTLDFKELLSGKEKREYVSIEEKKDLEEYFLSLEIGKESTIKVPSGFGVAESGYLLLKKIYWPAEGIDNFDDLPIPFRAVTTDLNKGEAVAQGHGDLALSVFKSMALPTIIDPVKDNGSYFVDGGVVRNLPVEDVRAMGADIVIAVDIGTPLILGENINIAQVLGKMSTYTDEKDLNYQKSLADILIVPDVKDHGTIDFTGIDDLIEKGKVATLEQKDLLSKLSYPGAAKERKISQDKITPHSVNIENIRIENSDILTPSVVKRLKPEHGEVDNEVITEWMKKVYALSYVDRVFYEVEGDTLALHVVENQGSQIKAGLNYDRGTDLTSIGLVGKFSNYDKYNTTNIIKANISEFPSLSFKRYKSYQLNDFKFYGSGEFRVGLTPLYLYRDDDQIGKLKSRDLSGIFTLGTSLYEIANLELFLGYKDIRNSYHSGEHLDVDFLNSNYFIGGATLGIDTLDRRYLSRDGFYLDTKTYNGTGVGSEDVDFRGAFYEARLFGPISNKFSYGLFSSGGKISGDLIPENEYYRIGGLRNYTDNNAFSFIGMHPMRYYAKEFLIAGGSLSYNVNRNFSFIGRYNVGTFTNIVFTESDEHDIWDDYEHGYGAGFGWNTFFGPIEFFLSNDSIDHGLLYNVYLGYTF